MDSAEIREACGS